MSNDDFSRREFLEVALAGTMAAGMGTNLFAEEKRGDIPYRTLGRTGEKVSAIGVGGYHMGIPKTEAEGIRIVRMAIDGGINFSDYELDALERVLRTGPVVQKQQNSGDHLHNKKEQRHAAEVIPDGMAMKWNFFLPGHCCERAYR